MKKYKLFIFIIILVLSNSKKFFGKKEDSYMKILRNLWESDMEYNSNSDEDTDSLEVCAKSSYKYFAYIMTGAPVTFEHSINMGNAVRINNLYNERIL